MLTVTVTIRVSRITPIFDIKDNCIIDREEN